MGGEGLTVMARWDWNVMDGLIPKALKAPLLCIEVPVSLILMRCVPRTQQFFLLEALNRGLI